MANDIQILGVRVDPTSYSSATAQVEAWAQKGESRYICVANVHMIMEAHDSQEFRDIVNAADLVTPDGMPLVWTLRRLGHPEQERVYGPELTLRVLDIAASHKTPVGFYGGSPDTLRRLVDVIKKKYPSIDIRYFHSPPFRPLTQQEDQAIIDEINRSGCSVLFVGLGCPKQERWMAARRGKIRAVMIGVGVAFDFYAGMKQQAPAWMQRYGLEWLFRLVQEPGRLWHRYLYHNPRFAVLILRQILSRGR